jgi:Carboxypeptidase regulatory-like domain
MRKWICRCALVWIATAVLLSSALAQDQTLTGTVLGADGQPKPFARVQLQGYAQFAAVSDVDGKFTIPNFKPGSYLVSIRQNDKVENQRQNIPGGTLTLQVKW